MESRDANRSASDVAEALRRAIATGELTAYFQPQIDLATGQVASLEALCRWNHPECGVLTPDRFIQVAEEYGLIAELGRLMLEESGRHAADWMRRGAGIGVAVNVSPSELRREFAEVVLDRVHAFDLPRGTVTVEITESPALQDSREEFLTLQSLVDGGVGVSVDDFGAGHTSLDGLRRLPFTEVKIDRSLMLDPRVETDELVAECVTIAHDRSAIVVAEGVETSADFARAVEWGCDRAQGFFFSPAVPAEELEPILAGR